jgi:hypothetical protein
MRPQQLDLAAIDVRPGVGGAFVAFHDHRG